MTRRLSAMPERVLRAEASVVGRQAAVPPAAASRENGWSYPWRSSRKSRRRADERRGARGQDERRTPMSLTRSEHDSQQTYRPPRRGGGTAARHAGGGRLR